MEDPFQIRTIIERFKARQVEYYLHYNLHPCTDDDIQFLEQELGCQLPASYVQFLKWAGRASANIFSDHYVAYRFIPWMQQRAKEMLQWDRQPPHLLPDDAIVILTADQDTGFEFFRWSEGANPPVYSYLGRETPVEKSAESFTAYLGQRVMTTARIHKIESHFQDMGDVETVEEVQKWVQQLIAILIDQFFVGWSEAEIDTLERELGVTLPAAYKTFLEIGGHRAGTLDIVGDMLKIQSYPNEILVENNLPITLPPSAFVCNFYSEGSGFTFFDLTEGDDPPIYECLLQSLELGFVKVADHFSQFLQQKATATKYPINHLSKYLPY
jgi:cell wall assembly regulator SMI1